MEHLMAIILAAGEGKRMKSKDKDFTRDMWQANGRVGLSMCENSGVDEIVLVVGRNSEEVKEYMGNKVFMQIRRNN